MYGKRGWQYGKEMGIHPPAPKRTRPGYGVPSNVAGSPRRLLDDDINTQEVVDVHSDSDRDGTNEWTVTCPGCHLTFTTYEVDDDEEVPPDSTLGASTRLEQTGRVLQEGGIASRWSMGVGIPPIGSRVEDGPETGVRDDPIWIDDEDDSAANA